MRKQNLRWMALALTLIGAPAFAADQAAYDAAVVAAKAAQQAAAAEGGEWRDIGAILKKAEIAAKSGNFGLAVKLANTARFHGEAGLAQARSQANVGNPSYLY